MAALEWDASLKDGSRVTFEIDEWQDLQKQSIKNLQLEGKVCPFNQTHTHTHEPFLSQHRRENVDFESSDCGWMDSEK